MSFMSCQHWLQRNSCTSADTAALWTVDTALAIQNPGLGARQLSYIFFFSVASQPASRHTPRPARGATRQSLGGGKRLSCCWSWFSIPNSMRGGLVFYEPDKTSMSSPESSIQHQEYSTKQQWGYLLFVSEFCARNCILASIIGNTISTAGAAAAAVRTTAVLQQYRTPNKKQSDKKCRLIITAKQDIREWLYGS